MTQEQQELYEREYYQMARTQLEETDKREFGRLSKAKELGSYLKTKTKAMLDELQTLMAQGMDQRTANEIVVNHHIVNQ